MDFQINSQQREMIDSVRSLAQTQFRAKAMRWMDGTFPWENMKQLAELGVLGMAVPEEYGGLNMSILDTALILEEIAKVDYVTAMAVMGETGVQVRVISRYAPQSIRDRILPRVVSGDCMLAVCMTEPHAGTDVANYRTNCRVMSDRVILKGTKTLISRAPEAGMFIVFTRVDGKPGREGIGCALLEPDTKGFSVTGTYHTMGGENLHEIQFDDCELPLENLVIREDGFRKLLTAFNTQRCLNPSISLGLAEGAFDEAVNYVRERTVFAKPIADFQGVRWKLADMFKDIEAGRGLLYRACLTANPFPDPFMAATAKVFCNEMSLRVTSEAVQLHGGFGFTDEYLVSRLYRGARYGSLGGGAAETLRDLIGKKIVGQFDPADGVMGLGTF
ncbi:acyl-CoA dehydrogenase family protein [Rhodopila sp.]|jgi:alkylation response protein AidB-like acyl-CoA dehydrogenase|uniref:acyl-CoA dehydrogenase family protein n=1 Tax=Rhodopila sp. TaxID=2480087 RepID=UPI002C76942A|nr:acyl-CoA dehydrogenase family protein [Rhodopila sp.]HVZ07095.1 acyl-CoA dehydrogenase family protein [Rhodopila sp.]